MKTVITIDPIQDCRWDKFIESHPLGWICHTSGWKHVLERTFKHIRGHHLAVVDGEEIVAALPLFAVRSWLTGKRLVSVPFATFSDPLLSTPEDMGILLNAVLNLSNNIGAKYVEIRITALDSGIADSRFDVSSQYKWTYLPLDCEPNELKKCFSRASIRKPLNQAIRRNLRLRIAEEKSELLTFYKLYLMLRKRLGLPPQPFLYFEALWDEFLHKGNLTLLLALYQDKIIAGHLLFKYKSRVSGEFAAWHQEYQHLRPHHLLIWEGIKLAYEQGYRIYDGGRTASDNIGLLKFKERWGMKSSDLHVLHFPKKRAERKETVRKLPYSMAKPLVQKMPSSILQIMGQLCYQHMG